MTVLINQLGTGVIPANEEMELIAEGTRFAAYFQTKRGNPILITSVHENIYARWFGQLTAQHNREHGLPSQYRIPSHTHAAPVAAT